MVDYQLCISKPGGTYTMPSTTRTATTATTTALVPTNLAQGTNTDCAEYYTAVSGDYCSLVIIKFSISLDDFLFLNPEVNENCTNLYAEEAYCVEAVGDINTYSGMPGYASTTAALALSTLAGDPATTWPSINYTRATATATASPLATDTRSDCWEYFNGTKYIGAAAAYSYPGSDCYMAAQVLEVTLEDLGVWNPCKWPPFTAIRHPDRTKL